MEEIVLKIDVQSEQGAKSLRSLRTEFKETQKELDNAVVGSEKYLNTLRKLGDLKGEIGDLNATINAFDGENKIGAVANSINGVTSGFQAAVGATALFGSESEDLNRSLLKVQATMAFVQGIQGVMALGESFAALNAVIAANPILAISTAIIAAIGLITASVVEQRKEEDKLQKQRQEAHYERMKQLEDEHNSALDFELQLRKARGGTEEELYQEEKRILQQKLADNRNAMANRRIHAEEYYKTEQDLVRQLTLLEAEHLNKREQAQQTSIAKKKEDNAKAMQDEMNKIIEMEQWMADREAEEIESDKKKEAEAQQKIIEQAQIEADYDAWLLEQKELNRQKEIADAKAATDAKIAEINREQQAYFQSAQASKSIGDNLLQVKLNNAKKGSDEERKLLKQQFQLNKAFQIANTIANTAAGIAKAVAASPLTSGLPFSAIVAAAGATQLAAIASSKFNDNVGGASSTPTTQSATIATPTTPTAQPQGVQIAQPTATRLNPDGTVQGTQQQQSVIKAYVVESEVTGTQQQVAKIKDNATIS